MAYNNGFPVGYQPMYVQQPTMPQIAPVQNQGNNSSMIWVQGETGAKSYLVAPNVTVPLWDSENQTIYLKSADGSGMPQMKILDYTVREPNTNKAPIEPINTDYATKKDIERLQDMIDNIKSQIETPKSSGRKKANDDE